MIIVVKINLPKEYSCTVIIAAIKRYLGSISGKSLLNHITIAPRPANAKPIPTERKMRYASEPENFGSTGTCSKSVL